LKAVYDIRVSSAETVGAFNTCFEIDSLHSSTFIPVRRLPVAVTYMGSCFVAAAAAAVAADSAAVANTPRGCFVALLPVVLGL
jgi:hypothetical protein